MTLVSHSVTLLSVWIDISTLNQKQNEIYTNWQLSPKTVLVRTHVFRDSKSWFVIIQQQSSSTLLILPLYSRVTKSWWFFVSRVFLPFQPSSSTSFLTMPRTPLAKIDGNSSKRKELSPFLWGQILGKASAGLNPSGISRELHIPWQSVVNTINNKAI